MSHTESHREPQRATESHSNEEQHGANGSHSDGEPGRAGRAEPGLTGPDLIFAGLSEAGRVELGRRWAGPGLAGPGHNDGNTETHSEPERATETFLNSPSNNINS